MIGAVTGRQNFSEMAQIQCNLVFWGNFQDLAQLQFTNKIWFIFFFLVKIGIQIDFWRNSSLKKIPTPSVRAYCTPSDHRHWLTASTLSQEDVQEDNWLPPQTTLCRQRQKTKETVTAETAIGGEVALVVQSGHLIPGSPGSPWLPLDCSTNPMTSCSFHDITCLGGRGIILWPDLRH